MARITISYRRDDSGVITGRIFDRLTAHYGREAIFRDIDDIPPGVDFRKHISGILDQSDIVLAIVGPRWIGPRGGQSRLANTADPVRVEIEIALQKDNPLIPVLVLRGSMPRPEQLPESLQDFAYRHAVSVDAGQDFDVHMARLIRAMDRTLEGAAERDEIAPAIDRAAGLDAGGGDAATVGFDAPLDRNLPSEPRSPPLADTPTVAPARLPPPPGAGERRRYLWRNIGLVLLGALIGVGAAFGAYESLMRDRPTLPGGATQTTDAKVKALQEQLRAAQLQADQDRKALAAAQKRLDDQAGDLRTAQSHAEKAEKDLAAQSAPLNAEIKRLRDQLEAQKGEVTKSSGHIDDLNSQVRGLNEQLTALREKNAQALAEIDRLKAQIAGSSGGAPAAASASTAAQGEASWTVEQKREVQLALRTLGHLHDEADGNFGPGTRNAIKQFQAFQGMPETGILSGADHQTLLGMAQRLAKLLERPAASPEGTAGVAIKGGAQRYARGVGFESGKGSRIDTAEAAYWYGLAATDGSAPALTNLGTLVARGYGGAAADPAGAATLWWAAAAHGEATAMFNLGALWERGIGVTPNLGKARAWYDRAADRNDTAARAALKRLGR